MLRASAPWTPRAPAASAAGGAAGAASGPAGALLFLLRRNGARMLRAAFFKAPAPAPAGACEGPTAGAAAAAWPLPPAPAPAAVAWAKPALGGVDGPTETGTTAGSSGASCAAAGAPPAGAPGAPAASGLPGARARAGSKAAEAAAAGAADPPPPCRSCAASSPLACRSAALTCAHAQPLLPRCSCTTVLARGAPCPACGCGAPAKPHLAAAPQQGRPSARVRVGGGRAGRRGRDLAFAWRDGPPPAPPRRLAHLVCAPRMLVQGRARRGRRAAAIAVRPCPINSDALALCCTWSLRCAVVLALTQTACAGSQVRACAGAIMQSFRQLLAEQLASCTAGPSACVHRRHTCWARTCHGGGDAGRLAGGHHLAHQARVLRAACPGCLVG